MANPDLVPGALQKPRRGSLALEREERSAVRLAKEDAAKWAAKARDFHRCRWPEAHKCKGFLEGAHLVPKGMGGDPSLLRTSRAGIVTLCAWIHRRGPETLEHHELKIEPETPAGADGPLSFWRRRDEAGSSTYHLVARERSIGVIERD